MIRALVARVTVSCLAGAVVLGVVSTLATPAVVQSQADGDPSPSPPPDTADTRAGQGTARVAEQVERLLEAHGCWTDAAPAGAPEPRHAVVSRPGGRPKLVAADVGYGIWLEGEAGVLHGFCP